LPAAFSLIGKFVLKPKNQSIPPTWNCLSLAWVPPTTHFLTTKKHENFIGVAALTDEMALGFAVWLVVLSDRSAD